MKNYYILLMFWLFPFLLIKGQIGINTESPVFPLEVVSSTSSATGKVFVASTSDGNESMQVRNDGYIGLGATNPLVKLDLRADNLAQENAIGIGYTSLTAAQAGAGAIRYETSLKVLQYSDGETWFTLQDNPDKYLLVAKNFSNISYVTEGNNNIASATLNNWTIQYENSPIFNRFTGHFVAPRKGQYSVSVTVFVEASSIISGAQFEVNIQHAKYNPGLVGVTVAKTVVPLLTPTTIPSNVTNAGHAVVSAEAGEVIYATLYMYRIIDPQLSADGSLTTITIAEM